jgi:hypothetical protein
MAAADISIIRPRRLPALMVTRTRRRPPLTMARQKASGRPHREGADVRMQSTDRRCPPLPLPRPRADRRRIVEDHVRHAGFAGGFEEPLSVLEHLPPREVMFTRQDEKSCRSSGSQSSPGKLRSMRQPASPGSVSRAPSPRDRAHRHRSSAEADRKNFRAGLKSYAGVSRCAISHVNAVLLRI